MPAGSTDHLSSWRVLLIDGLKVKVLGADGSPLRSLTIDPKVNYQRQP